MAVHRRPLVDGPPLEVVVFRTATLHGRLAIIGLSFLNPVLRERLEEGAFLETEGRPKSTGPCLNPKTRFGFAT